MIIKCCKNCEERHAGCHSYCESYISEKAAFNKEKELREKRRDIIEYRIQKYRETLDTDARNKMSRRKWNLKRSR